MRIGLTYTVRTQLPAGGDSESISHARDDAEEEFDAPETIEAIAAAVRQLGHKVELLGDGPPLVRRLLEGPRPELVLNFAEGRGSSRSREARVPALLEMLDVPYTGSDPLTLAVTLDKDCAKRLVAAAGVATPKWVRFDGELTAVEEPLASLPLPALVKPACEGSSKGIRATSLVDDRAELAAALVRLFDVYEQPILAEEFIEGDELTVGMVGNDPPSVLAAMRVLPTQPQSRFIYSLEVKRGWRAQVRYECPARLPERHTQVVHQAALDCWRALGCRDVARVDFRLRRGVPYFLECNPLPGLSPEAGDLALLARAVGIDYVALVGRILQAAIERAGRHWPAAVGA